MGAAPHSIGPIPPLSRTGTDSTTGTAGGVSPGEGGEFKGEGEDVGGNGGGGGSWGIQGDGMGEMLGGEEIWLRFPDLRLREVGFMGG